MAELSPMMQQYMNIKEKHKDHILFFRLGDFYEMFFDDALLASKELELVLTGRDCGLPERAPMCGVPHHSSDTYIARLIKKGYKVAICEQTEDPALAKGIVKREVVRVITPGTIIESNMLEEGANNYICSVYAHDNGFGAAFADISTGEVQLTSITADPEHGLINELGRFAPSEIIFNSQLLRSTKTVDFIKSRLHASTSLLQDMAYNEHACRPLLLKHFKVQNLAQLGLQDSPELVCAMGGLLWYLSQTQRQGLDALRLLTIFSGKQYMELGELTRRNLEICETLREKEKRGSLLWVMDKTKTAMGKRLLRSYLEMPLISPAVITKRLNAVTELYDNTPLLTALTQKLSHISDLERIMTRVVYGSATPREIKAMGLTFERLPEIRTLLKDAASQFLREIHDETDPLQDLYKLIAGALVDEPPAGLKDGGVIRAGYNGELDDLRSLGSDNRERLAEIERTEREKTGIKTLKIGYNKVFGYFLEVTRSQSEQVPEHYIRKQTLSNCERYITQELKELEVRALSAHERILALEAELFAQLRSIIAAQLHRIQATAGAISRLDVFCSLATLARQNHYCCPNISMSEGIHIKDGRHPVVETMLTEVPFVPNDMELSGTNKHIAVITGPNMAGKSTYMRQCALIVLMAQIGSYVPAAFADIGIVDGIYTRVGASDDLAAGQSTFMVEMNEVADILRNATAKSLIILDEIGRGTSTFDGMSIARAVLEYIADKRKLGAKTMFATHYHELTELESQLAGVKNYNVSVRKRGEDVIFLRRIVPGAADDSYGVYVAKLAGVPSSIIRRANEILALLEQGAPVCVTANKNSVGKDENQIILTQADDTELIRRIKELDLGNITPIQAMNLLYELKDLV